MVIKKGKVEFSKAHEGLSEKLIRPFIVFIKITPVMTLLKFKYNVKNGILCYHFILVRKYQIPKINMKYLNTCSTLNLFSKQVYSGHYYLNIIKYKIK